MELTVKERVVLAGILPKEGDLTTLKIVRKLKEDLSFSEDEHKLLNFNRDGDQLTWVQDAVGPTDIEIGEKAMDVIKGSFRALNNRKLLVDDHIELYDKFVGE